VWRDTDWMNAFRELKRSEQPNVADLFTAGTGGEHYSFFRERTLEKVIQQLGEDLHGQYLLSFTPRLDGREFHSIRVAIRGLPDLTARTRIGYWPRLSE